MKKGIILASGLFLLTLCSGCAALAQYGDLIAKGAVLILKYVTTSGEEENQKEVKDRSELTMIPEISLQ